jgi:hypothetical protein
VPSLMEYITGSRTTPTAESAAKTKERLDAALAAKATPQGATHPPIHEPGPAVAADASKESIMALMNAEAKAAFPLLGGKGALEAFKATKRGELLVTAYDAAKSTTTKSSTMPTPATAGPTRSVVQAKFDREAVAAFPGMTLPLASVAFVETERGKAMHAAVASAPPDPVVQKSATETRSEVFGRIVQMGTEIAAREGLPESVAFTKALQTDEGKRLHEQYVGATPDPDVVEKTVAPSSDPVDVLGRTIVEETNRIAKADGVPIEEADRRFRATPAGRLMTRGYAHERGLT